MSKALRIFLAGSQKAIARSKIATVVLKKALLITLLMIGFTFFGIALAAAVHQPILEADFNSRVQFILGGQEPKTINLPYKGFEFKEGLTGKTIHFKGQTRIKVPGVNLIDPSEGTVMLWVKPLYPKDDGFNHVFLHQPIAGIKGSFTLWDVRDRDWGGHRFFFDYGKISMPFNGINYLEPAVWSHLAVTWKSGPKGYVRFFLNGEVIRHVHLKRELKRTKGDLLIGGRRDMHPADSLIDGLKIYRKALSTNEVDQIYNKECPQWEVHQSAWMGPEKKPPKILRNKAGQLIEARVLFDEEPYFIDDLEGVLDKLKRGNFNVYVPCIWYGDGARWKSEIELIQKDYYLHSAIRGKDLLSDLIDKAHAAGIQVHPWFCVAKRLGDAHPEFAEKGTPGGKYNVHLEGFDDFIAGLIKEVVTKYDVDGINLDYIRTGGICNSSSCRAIYKKMTGRNLLLDSGFRREHEAYLKWQAETMNKIVEKISSVARAARPDIIISVDSAPVSPGKLSNQGRNHKIWLEKGWIDLVFFMDYGLRLKVEENARDRTALPNPNSAFVIIGNYDWTEDNKYRPRNAPKLVRLGNFCRDHWPGVIGMYLYQQLDESQIEALVAGPFKEKALPDWEAIINQ